MLVTPLSASMSFAEASASFLSSRATIQAHGRIRYVAPRTYTAYGEDIRMLRVFFGELRLDAIHAGHIRSYQQARAMGDGFTRRMGGRQNAREVPTIAGAPKINNELGLLKRIMMLAQAWTPQLEANYLRLQEPESDMPKALSPAEQDHFLEKAAGNPDWNVIWWYSLVVLCTTFSSDEMRTLRQGDINLTHQMISVNPKHGKNTYRRREVTINDGACMFALERLIERSVRLGGRGPERFLFPLCLARGHYDGEQHTSRSGLRKDFEAVRDAAGVPWFCLNGLRHTAITRMAEAGVYWPTIQKRAGHVTAKMTWHYVHISEQVERAAMKGFHEKKPVVSIRHTQLRRNLA